mmetsp:Transcript_52318/g.167771  ORF Transcript_52318/g.167771 Transcript_52318/m.167771 type:complete len:310 (-) Transcript_52318:111-1040(-)
METYGLEDVDDSMLLDPPDPVDLLIAHTEDSTGRKPRPLDFVRAKFQEMKKENKRLKERVLDLEQTLSIVQTAQEWSVSKKMTPEQAEKMREIKGLLEQAKKAREDIQKFSDTSRATLYDKLRACKNALRREREEKREMKERLMHAFDCARSIREQHRQLAQQRLEEQEQWQQQVSEMKERHRRELRRLQGDGAAMEADRQDKLSHFGEQVIGELSALQQHIHEVQQETVSNIILEGDDLGDAQPDSSAPPASSGGYPTSAGANAATTGGFTGFAGAAGETGESAGEPIGGSTGEPIVGGGQYEDDDFE